MLYIKWPLLLHYLIMMLHRYIYIYMYRYYAQAPKIDQHSPGTDAIHNKFSNHGLPVVLGRALIEAWGAYDLVPISPGPVQDMHRISRSRMQIERNFSEHTSCLVNWDVADWRASKILNGNSWNDPRNSWTFPDSEKFKKVKGTVGHPFFVLKWLVWTTFSSNSPRCQFHTFQMCVSWFLCWPPSSTKGIGNVR